MKKGIVGIVVLTILAFSVGIAYAEKVDLDGTITIENRQEKNDGVKDDGTKYVFKVNAKINIDKNLSFYSRFAAEGLSNSKTMLGSDLNSKVYSDNFGADIDQFGFVYYNAGFTYKIGRQDVFIGSGLLYDNTLNIGKNGFADGVSIAGKLGKTSLDLIAAQEDCYGGNDNKLYAFHTAFHPVANLSVGVAFAQFDNVKTQMNTNHWAIDGAYSMGKAVISGDYAHSNVSEANKAYSLGVKYAIDSKNSVSVTYFNVEENADMNGMTTWWSGQKGYWYGFKHKLTKDSTFSLAYIDRTVLSDNTKKTSFRTTVSYKF